MPRFLRAKFVAPVAAPPIENGFVAINGDRIVDVGRFDDGACASSDLDDLGEVVLLPGLVNAHTHLEFSHASPGERPSSFGDWLKRIVARRAAVTPEAYAEATGRAAIDGAAECLRFGVTTIGDISRECGVTRRALGSSPLNIVSFGEVQAMAQRRQLLEERLAVAIDATYASDHIAIGLSPHAPYTVEPDAYRRCVEVARDRKLPICTHLAESPEESEFLTHQTGLLRELWDGLGSWDYEVPAWPGSPMNLAKETGLLDLAPLLAHVNYVTENDFQTLAASNATVVWCPRTHTYFGHPPHRWREMLARGINVCVGTDSKASSPDLNVVDDLRLVHRQSPEVSCDVLWEMVTTRAARGLHRGDVGAIAAGMRADLVAFEVRGGEPLREVLETGTLPTAIVIAGEKQAMSSRGA